MTVVHILSWRCCWPQKDVKMMLDKVSQAIISPWKAVSEYPHFQRHRNIILVVILSYIMLYLHLNAIQYIYIYIIYKYTSSNAQGGGGSFTNRKPIGEVGCCESRMAERIHWWTDRWLEMCFLEWLQWLQVVTLPQLLDVVWCSAVAIVSGSCSCSCSCSCSVV